VRGVEEVYAVEGVSRPGALEWGMHKRGESPLHGIEGEDSIIQGFGSGDGPRHCAGRRRWMVVVDGVVGVSGWCQWSSVARPFQQAQGTSRSRHIQCDPVNESSTPGLGRVPSLAGQSSLPLRQTQPNG
jgi:hypothetical protein